MSHNPDCIFCKIVSGVIPSHKVWEDENHLAFLDLFPLRYAQTVVIPKAHVPSGVFSLPDAIYNPLLFAGKKTAELLEKSLGAERTMMVVEGLEIDHAHLKLYPRFEGESGLVHSGPMAENEKLAELAEKIRRG